MNISIDHNFVFIVAIIFFVLAIIPGMRPAWPWVVLGHIAVAFGLFLAL